MSNKVKILVGVLGVLILAALAVYFFLRYQIHKSFPQTTGSIALSGLTDRVEVVRDEYDVPHIIARNEHDLLYAQGFVHAQERLWQMDMERRAGEGRLSEILGKATVAFDEMFRTVGLERISGEIARNLPPESLNRLQWYADGVNAFIESHHGKYPVEFDLLQYEPEPWTPEHTIVIGRLMAWELNLSWWTDLTYGAIAEKVDLQRALDIFPPYPKEVAPVVAPAEWRRYAGLGRGYLRTAQEYCDFFGRGGMAGGSNAWAVALSRSATGGVLLANDTHLALATPSKWFEIQLQAPGLRVHGMSVPGAPWIVAGRNDSIAWGMTNVMADDADFYIERLDSTDATKYFYDGQWLPLTSTHEEIHVRGDSVVPLTVRFTHHGPIVSDIRMPFQSSHTLHVASMRWTGAGLDDQFDAFMKIDHARNWGEFTNGVREFAVPGQNFVYGDVEGNIGYWCGLKLPIRGKLNPLLPLPGWDKSAEWKGFVPFEHLPHLFNPPEGYIATANNKIVDDSYPYFISDLWEPPSRILRLREVLGRNTIFTESDCERLQNDKFSFNAAEIVPYILKAFRDSTAGAQDTTELDYLRNWDFAFGEGDIATMIYQEFLVRLINNIYRDEMGDDLFHDWVLLVNVPIRVTTKLLHEGTSPWFDDVATAAVETRDMIIRKSLREAAEELRRRFGDDRKVWRWGDAHTVTLQHPFGLKKPLDKIFSVGPFHYPGGSTSLMSGEYSFNDPFAVTVAASFRQVFDMANPEEITVVLPPGQSGQVFHDHYSDQASLWLNGAYRVARMDETEGRHDHLTLEPRP